MTTSATIAVGSNGPLGITRTIVGALLIPFIAIFASFYGASVAISVDDHAELIALFSPAILLEGLYLFPVTLGVAFVGWLASFVPLGLWFLARLITAVWVRIVTCTIGAAVLIALGATLGEHVIKDLANSFGGLPANQPVSAVDAGAFIGTFAMSLVLVGLATVLTNLASSPSQQGTLSPGNTVG